MVISSLQEEKTWIRVFDFHTGAEVDESFIFLTNILSYFSILGSFSTTFLSFLSLLFSLSFLSSTDSGCEMTVIAASIC